MSSLANLLTFILHNSGEYYFVVREKTWHKLLTVSNIYTKYIIIIWE